MFQLNPESIESIEIEEMCKQWSFIWSKIHHYPYFITWNEIKET